MSVAQAPANRQVTYIDQGVAVPQDHSCMICHEGSEKEKFIRHTGEFCQNNAVHKSCAKRWISSHPTCPTGCGSKVTNTLENRTEKFINNTSRAASHAALGAKQIENDYIFGTIALATVAALELGGMRSVKNVLAVAGGSYAAALFIGYVFGRGPESGVEDRVSATPIGAFTGMVIGLFAWYAGETENSTLFQVIATAALAKSIGFKRLLLSTSTGALSSFLLGRTLYFANYAPAIAGALGALPNVKNSPWFISAIALKTGYTIGSICTLSLKSLGKYSSIVSGVIGAGGAAIASNLLTRGYRAVKNPA